MQSAYLDDESLKFIKFRHLKELNLSGTVITPRGPTCILNALCSISGVGNGETFTSLSKQLVNSRFDYPKECHINLLASEFLNLKLLRLCFTLKNSCDPSKGFGISVKFLS
jgi:hypothetical protein